MIFFEKQELFDIWQIHNYKNYVCDGPSPMTNGLMVANAKPTLENIIAAADEAIASVETRLLSALHMMETLSPGRIDEVGELL